MAGNESNKGKSVDRNRRDEDEDENRRQRLRKSDHHWDGDLDEDGIHAIQAVLKRYGTEKKKRIDRAKQHGDDGPASSDDQSDDEAANTDDDDDDDDDVRLLL
ncbi:hypothetical protein FS749_009501 [Ceratobasidium sp. UAMH 11750]|nr:hypothetical protein FS749_009501 [Ceratobasidium sp. UAMH 11750]